MELPIHHITIRVPWHDSGWSGNVCSRPDDNSSCLVLPRIGQGRDLATELPCAGQSLIDLAEVARPPCIAERVAFMSGKDIQRNMNHPYTQTSPTTHGHFKPTPFHEPAWSAACVPFRWMLRSTVEGDAKARIPGLAETLQLDWRPEREPELDFKTSWIQDRENQLASLETFFGAVQPQESLCFFYAKRTPLSEQSRRVIVGVGRVLSVGKPVEYKYSVNNPDVRCMLWERSIGHSIRPAFKDGFLFPYQNVLQQALGDGDLNPEEFVAFAPDDHFDRYSYGSELLTHDGAIASLVACAATLEKLRGRFDGPWDMPLAWTNNELNRLWTARGAFPGLGSALAAFGYEWGYRFGTLLGYEIAAAHERGAADNNPWAIVDKVMSGALALQGFASNGIKDSMRKGWQAMPTERRILLELLSRSALTEEQALRIWDRQERAAANIGVSDAELLANPYRLFEDDRYSQNAIAFNTVDRGMFPDESLRERFPLPQPSLVDDPADSRRVRALVASLLESASEQGHTLLPRDLVIARARELSLQPPCPLGDAVLDAAQATFEPIIQHAQTANGGSAYQLDRLGQYRKAIVREVTKRSAGKRHAGKHAWTQLIDSIIASPLPDDATQRVIEQRARQEKAAALEEIFGARVAVLIGPAGTGKTTLIKALLSLEEVSTGGVLLLAPTGKARVRLEQQTDRRGAGQTIAQLLIRQKRYDWRTGRYFMNTKAPKVTAYKNVIIDECSMLTEDQLAALLDALGNVERLIMVGDTRQLPPIGAGRPFVDIVNKLRPEAVMSLFPRTGRCYAELTVPRRQIGKDRDDILLAMNFAGSELDPGADEVWDRLARGGDGTVKLVQWTDGRDLENKLVDELVEILGLAGPNDEQGFELALGGSQYQGTGRALFWAGRDGKPGAAAKAAEWQVLSPVRAGLPGVDALNRMIQKRFRDTCRRLSTPPPDEYWKRKTPTPLGAESILYGDKVINVRNASRKPGSVYPKPAESKFVANGDLGIVVGQYKTKYMKGLPWANEVEFENEQGTKFTFYKSEFSDEGPKPLELAYALTVHKTQGSQFGRTFVVLPNPCWLLSRELLYTALTRHENQLVIMHQGPIHDFRRLSNDAESEILRRITNLFIDPSPAAITVGQQTRFLEEHLIHRTARGDLVRSKSEVIIADKLYARGIEYGYEQPVVLPDGSHRYPDFTIVDQASGTSFYWEHLGMLNDPLYLARWNKKRVAYLAAGIKPWQEDGGEKGTLIETKDNASGGIDSQELDRIIEESGLA